MSTMIQNTSYLATNPATPSLAFVATNANQGQHTQRREEDKVQDKKGKAFGHAVHDGSINAPQEYLKKHAQLNHLQPCGILSNTMNKPLKYRQIVGRLQQLGESRHGICQNHPDQYVTKKRSKYCPATRK